MDDLIERIFRDIVENSEYIKDIDNVIDTYIPKLVSLYPDGITKEQRENIVDVVLDMAAVVREKVFILGFKFAITFWTEALLEGRGERNGE